MNNIKVLIVNILPYLKYLQFCVIRENEYYTDSYPVITKYNRCSSTAVLLLRLFVGKSIYKVIHTLSSLNITRYIEDSPKRNISIEYINSLEDDFISRGNFIYYINIVKHYNKLIDNNTKLNSHTFLIEQTGTKDPLYIFYQSYHNEYNLDYYLSKYNNEYTFDDINVFIKDMKYLFRRSKWSTKCSEIWKRYFKKTLSNNIQDTIKNNLFFVYYRFPIKTPKEKLLSFVENNIQEIKDKIQNQYYDIPALYDEKMVKNKDMIHLLDSIKNKLNFN
jgi:hypothetical protein